MTTARRVFLIWCLAWWSILSPARAAPAQELDLEGVLSDHPEIRLAIEQKIIDYQTLATVLGLYHQGRYREAITLVEEALKHSEKILGPEHTFVATVKHFLALLYFRIGNFAQAKPLQQEALDVRLKLLGPEHPQVGASYSNLALLYSCLASYEKAVPLYLESLKIREKSLGPEHFETAISLNCLAALYQTLGIYDQALLLYQRS